MKRQIVKNKQEFIDWVNAYNGKMNCYTTVYDFAVVNENTKINSSVILDRIFLDFDAHDEPLEKAYEDFLSVSQKFLDEDIMFRPLFSGKGFHIIAYGEIAKDIRSIQNYYGTLAADHPTLDSSGIQTNRLRRVPQTLNLSSDGYYCIPYDSFWLLNHATLIDFSVEHILTVASNSKAVSKMLPTKFGKKRIQWPEVAPIEQANVEIEIPTPIGKLPIIPCLHNAIMVENPNHMARVYLVQWYRDLLTMGEREIDAEQKQKLIGVIMNELETIASQDDIWLDWDERKTRGYVKGIVNKGYHAPGCNTVLIPQGYCPGKCWRYYE